LLGRMGCGNSYLIDYLAFDHIDSNSLGKGTTNIYSYPYASTIIFHLDGLLGAPSFAEQHNLNSIIITIAER